MQSRILPLIFSFMIWQSGAPVWAEPWPQWRGPAGDGNSRETGLPTTWTETANVVWKSALPAWGTSTPAVWNDAIFLTVQHDDGLLQTLRLNAADGRIVWTRDVGRSDTVREAAKRSVQKYHRLHNAASPSPVTDGKTVFVHFGNGDLAAFDFDGKQLWKRNLQDDYGPYSIWWGRANSPVLFGDLVISVCMQDSLEGTTAETAPKQALSYVVAHDQRTGELRWYTPRATPAQAEQCDSYTTPVLHQAADGLEIIVMGGNRLDCYDPATGRKRWHLDGLVGGRTITGPVVAGQTVYATRGQKGELWAVKLGLSPSGTDGSLAETAVAFRHGEATPDTCCPVVMNGLVFIISDNGIAQCIDAASGEARWKERLPGDYKASPLGAEGRVYFVNTSGLATVIAADGAAFTKLAENQLDDEILASPAIADGKLYLRGKSKLYCIAK
jgi:outer membrane protein assembly factor BamB